MYIASISNPLQYSESRQPLDAVTSYLTDKILADIDKLQGNEGSSKPQLYTATPGFQNRTKADLIAGKQNLGAMALGNSHHMLAQAVHLVTQGHKNIDHFNLNQLGNIYSQDPNFHDKQTIVTLISDWISAMINAHVDVAKDPYINRLNVRKFTLNMTNYLLRAGKGESTFYFLSQKILRDIASEFEALSGYYGVDDNLGDAASAAKSKVKQTYLDKLNSFGWTLDKVNAELERMTKPGGINPFDIKTLREFMPEDNSAKWYLNQLAILKVFEDIEPFAKALSENTKLSQIDTKKYGNNFALQQNFLIKMAEFAQNDKVFADPLSVIRNTFLKDKLYYALIRPRQYIGNVLLRTTPEFENKRRKIYQITGRHHASSDKYVNDITRMMEACYKTTFWKEYAAKNGVKVGSLLAGSNSVPRRLYTIKQLIKSNPALGLLNSDGSFSNTLLDSISMMIKTDKQDMVLPDFIQFKHNRSDDHNLDDHLIRAWEELLELTTTDATLQPQVDIIRNFARDLVIYSFFTSGDAFGRNNIFKYVPESFRESCGYYDYIRKLESEPSTILDKIDEEDVIKNLWWNDEVVPSHNEIIKEYYDDEFVKHYELNNWYIPSNKTVRKGVEDVPVPLLMSVPKAKVIGLNTLEQPLYQPYIKVDFGGRNNPLTTHVYRFVGTREFEVIGRNGMPVLDSEGKPVTRQQPIYTLINKKGLKHKGRVIVETSGIPRSLLGINNNNELPKDFFINNAIKFNLDSNKSMNLKVEEGYVGEIEWLKDKLFTTKLLDEAVDREDLPEDVRQYLAPDEKEATQIVRESVELAKQGLKITNELGDFFTKEEQDLIKQATKDKRLFVKSASRRTDPAFFTEEIIKQLKENDKLPFGHPDRFYAIEIWSKHDGIPMVDLIDACIKYRVAPMHSFSISTLGNSALEPGVLKSDDLLDKIQNLINDGKINPKTTTIRIDPLLPGVTKLEDVEHVVQRASEMGITKFVSSVMQSYGWTEKSKHPRGIVPALKSRINYDWAKYYKILPDGTVNNKPKEEAVKPFSDKLHELIDKYGVEIKSCASNNLKLEEAACLDPIVLENLTGVEIDKNYKDKTRLECMCYGAHGDMLKYSDVCLSCCAYCYAAQQNDGSQYQYYDENGNKLDLALTRTSRIPQVNLDKRSDESVSLVSESNNPADYTMHSGGAYGADTMWDEVARSFGISNINHYRDADNTKLSSKLSKAGITAAELSESQMNEARKEMSRLFNREFKNNLKDNLKVRNYYQVVNSDAVYAISELNADLTTVKGGTSYAVNLAKKLNKPVYVFSPSTRMWYEYAYDVNVFEPTATTPRLSQRFAGIGTRDIELYKKKDKTTGAYADNPNYLGKDAEDASRNAIIELFNNTFGIKSEIDDTTTSSSTRLNTYSGLITKDDPAIFVFGSNSAAYNGNPSKGTGGAALAALNQGRIEQREQMANTLSKSGRAYGIQTVTTPGAKKSLSEQEIVENIVKFYRFAVNHPDNTFKVAYTYSEKPNLNGYTSDDMATMFALAFVKAAQELNNYAILNNIQFHESFAPLVNEAMGMIGRTVVKYPQEFEQFVAETSTWYDEQDIKSVQKELSELPKAKSTPSFTFADGTKIDTPFELNEQQKFALLELEKFYNGNETFFSLQGYAGTGKTTIMKIFDAYMRKKYDQPLYLAPTHKANAVTKANNPDVNASTVHSALGIVPSYDMTSDSFDVSKITFDDPGEAKIEKQQVVILDECSMLPDALVDYICDAVREKDSKLIFLGDPAQLSPVKQSTLSKSFNMNSKVELTKVERTGNNSILKEATNLRESKPLSYQTDLNSKGHGIMFTNNNNTIAILLQSVLKSDEFKANPLHFKILSGTNDLIPIYNNIVRTILYGKDAPTLVKGELLMSYANAQYNNKNKKRPYNIINSGDYMVDKIDEVTNKSIPHMPGFEITGRNVELIELPSGHRIKTFLVDKSVPNKTLRAITLRVRELWAENKRLRAEKQFTAAGIIFDQIRDIEQSFTTMSNIIDEETGAVIKSKTFDYGYTQSVHKSQGSTYDKVMVIGGSFDKFPSESIRQQLKYVAVTRAREQVIYTVPTNVQVNPQGLSQITKAKWAEIQERLKQCKG